MIELCQAALVCLPRRRHIPLDLAAAGGYKGGA
jgi:hypothetical protein